MFCNPPYGKEIPLWVEKAYREHEQHGITVVLLIPARTDTSYWHDYILHGKAAEIRFLRGRLRFEDEDGKPAKDKAPFPSAVVIYRRTNGRHERDAAVYGARHAGGQGQAEIQPGRGWSEDLHPGEDRKL